MKIIIEMLSDIVLRPKKYAHVIGLPGQFDAAKELYANHIEEISDKVYKKCADILIKSGKYITVTN